MTWEIFRDQIWNFIGVIVASVTLLVSLILFFLQKYKKGLSYEITAKNSLLTTREKIEGKIKVLFDDKEVQNVNFIEICITNSGNIGIPANDYERPLRFIFGAETRVLSSEIIKSHPENLITSIQIEQNEIIVQAVLMNSKDSITIKSIISNSTDNEILVDARIRDVKEIRKQGESYMSFIYAFLGIGLTIAGLAQMSTLESAVKVETPWTMQKTIGLGLIFLGYLMFVIMFSRGKYKRFILRFLRN